MSLETFHSLGISEREFVITFARSSGPGGQNVNKVSSKVVLRWKPSESQSLCPDVVNRFVSKYRSRITAEGDFIIMCDEHRDQKRNIEICKERLADLLLSVLHPPKARKPTKPTKGAKERRIKGKKAQAQRRANRKVEH